MGFILADQGSRRLQKDGDQYKFAKNTTICTVRTTTSENTDRTQRLIQQQVRRLKGGVRPSGSSFFFGLFDLFFLFVFGLTGCTISCNISYKGTFFVPSREENEKKKQAKHKTGKMKRNASKKTKQEK